MSISVSIGKRCDHRMRRQREVPSGLFEMRGDTSWVREYFFRLRRYNLYFTRREEFHAGEPDEGLFQLRCSFCAIRHLRFHAAVCADTPNGEGSGRAV